MYGAIREHRIMPEDGGAPTLRSRLSISTNLARRPAPHWLRPIYVPFATFVGPRKVARGIFVIRIPNGLYGRDGHAAGALAAAAAGLHKRIWLNLNFELI